MIKNRFFMFGLGTGLIAGALLLQLMISGGAAPMTKEQLVREAAKLNLTVTDPAASGAAEPTADPEAAVQGTGPEGQNGDAVSTPAASTAPAPSASPSPSAAASPQAAVQPSTAAAPAEPSAPAEPVSTAGQANPPAAPATPKPAGNNVISVNIPAGSTLTQTAELLAKAGVIKDKAGFLQTAINRKVNTKIQNGYHTFIQGESNNSIIDKLITVR
ncbi:hypothetical protein C2I18_00100 [Paenibacillus sp. PK3_47]|uniref:endolytic transglycosylase MltG n=1 Tax=Paenibacillus sp. PK3_47 TaxID=2072642 RepID=UPI00201DCE47|nr:endolytic transglycosylase MltG [Paenibacillus sp. PK3_47]UQZ32088.1 hypothetical protein C2I18_00100 [Paenibacillus sp. PK3_47]